MSLTEQGFARPRLPEIKNDYDQRFADALGPVNTGADAVVGQIVGIFSAALDDAYEVLQDNYDAMYPFSAEGTSLDGAVAFVGLQRLAASPTTVTAVCYGTEGTLVPAGAVARAADNRQYASAENAVISRSNCADVVIEPNTILDNSPYQIILNGTSVSYTSDATATKAEIVAGLAALLDPNQVSVTANANTLRICVLNQADHFTVTLDSKLSAAKLGSPVQFNSFELGAYPLPANSLTRIDSSVLGWDEVNNLFAGATGRFVETDAELRRRHSLSVRAVGAATSQSIRARILAEVESVSSCSIYENRTNTIDANGLPPHSFEAVIKGGADQAVADKLFEVKPAGIETHGNTVVQVRDENGDAQTCKFSRPADRYAWVRVTVNALNPEEMLSPQIAQAIKAAVMGYGASIGIGEDIITQRFYGPIYAATSGLGSITVEAALTGAPTDTPVYSVANVVIARAELAMFSEARIAVAGV